MWGLELVLGKRRLTLAIVFSSGSETTPISEPSSEPSEETWKKKAEEVEGWAHVFADLLREWVVCERTDKRVERTRQKIREFSDWA